MDPKTRKKIDTLFRAPGRSLNHNPEKKIQVGDYGLVDPGTGDFEFHGNIYEDGEILELLPELRTRECRPRIYGSVEHWIVTANKTQLGEFDAESTGELPGTENACIKVKFNIKSGHRGGFLAMYDSRTVDLPEDKLLHKLAKLDLLKKKHLVTSLISCPAYALCLTDRGTESVQLAFVDDPPAGGEVCVGWKINKSADMYYQEGYDPAGQYKYSPLYTTKQIRRPLDWIFR